MTYKKFSGKTILRGSASIKMTDFPKITCFSSVFQIIDLSSCLSSPVGTFHISYQYRKSNETIFESYHRMES